MSTDWVDDERPECHCVVWHTCGRNSTANGTEPTEVSGIEWCATHDDFAIEGYDWSEVCHEAWMNGDQDPDEAGCDLRPMYVRTATP